MENIILSTEFSFITSQCCAFPELLYYIYEDLSALFQNIHPNSAPSVYANHECVKWNH